jgi:alkanesulfonate monooxygenase SsuD/methylene tetrahydromethanopterin reductase-like flavin-dependent oxidoreductase (luciferase family)
VWSGDNGPYQGRHYQLAETLCVPQPVQRPRPPILIGGGGERKTLRLVARYADACNLFGSSPEDVARKLEVLRSHCEAEGRDYDSIEKTVLAVRPALADVDDFIAAAGEYARLGVTEIGSMPDPGRSPVEWAEEVAERVMPRLSQVG